METAPQAWAEFGRQLRVWRRRAGLTQLQLGLRMGYHNSLISRLESGLREPQAGLADRLDDLLGTNGELSAILAHPSATPRLDRALFSPIPAGNGSEALTPLNVRSWPTRLPDCGISCPLHGNTGCELPPAADVLDLFAGINRHGLPALPSTADPDVLHGMTALLAGCEKASAHLVATEFVDSVERALHLVVRWAETVNAAGRVPRVQLRLAAGYAQIAGRLRMQRGQSTMGMAWFAHGMRWAEVSDNLTVRATLHTDLSLLARLDGDPASALGYAQALGVLEPGRAWMVALSHLYQSRAHALNGLAAPCRRHICLARRKVSQLDERDLLEAPWLAGADGELRVETAVGGALRDLAAVTGDRATGRQAVHAVQRALAQLPQHMRATYLLLTLRLADAHACAGDFDTALSVANPVVGEAIQADRFTLNHELRGLRRRLIGRWGDLHQARDPFGEPGFAGF
ncbi:helix-turn-helix domain-containing protein [Kutzneria albida]|uniref:HTH cro/C1-type domain-containing protein n=1 Tax=Kutzneria albida DSM 43870 TaxID=1449976 RepID=W5WMI4_9PSEU|nr:helix-turn-helix transcriptional regulator [Kutzneria albida]AHH99389.1 hypothetical protein KALB_6029 [Kutzneria albida DSM 43870]